MDRRTVEREHLTRSGGILAGDGLYLAAVRGQRGWRLRSSGTTISSATSLFQGTYGRVRDIARNPRDGAVRLMTSDNGLSGTDRSGDDRTVRSPRFP